MVRKNAVSEYHREFRPLSDYVYRNGLWTLAPKVNDMPKGANCGREDKFQYLTSARHAVANDAGSSLDVVGYAFRYQCCMVQL